ncbi:hypothetical protein FNV43_RR03595 [Rhamnella rubrinervis]|uniref:Uncharacterized protein n=1 Tax=Rhamnella rubrinervis TaxID=2594499 RepID=A0A8K0MPF9_9ROSA|nr:hypothetical protein FNV43_RR03595 [Rhamnella rubrinervis]
MIDIIIGIAAIVAEYTVAPIGRQLGYLFCYKRNVEDLNSKIVDLKNVKQSLQHEVEEAQRNGENIEAVVNEWVTKVDKIITEDHGNFTQHEEEGITKFTCGAKFPNLVLRHRLSRKAKKMAVTIAAQIQYREKITKVSYRPPPSYPVENKGYEEFESRNQILTDVMKVLRDPGVGMVGLWGMGGMGKTMLSKEAATKAMDKEKLFTKFIFTTISKDPDIKKIQQDIGEYLDMTLDEENKDIRAARLRERLRQENKILIIVDDIWEKLDLEDVGISFGIHQRGCKILLTTRSFHVLANDMGVDSNVIFAVGHLSEHEAMSLFHKIVGDQAEKDDDFQGLEAEIVKECGGLPLAITTVASMEKEVYKSIKLSFDFLESKEAKHLLLLCSLFPEDANIEIRELCIYGFGFNLFENVNTLEEARNRTDTLVANLKHRSLLDGGFRFGYVKLHDVIRDVVIFIVSKLDDHPRMRNIRDVVELDKYVNEEMCKDSTAMSVYGIKADQYPQTLKAPELKLLSVLRTIIGRLILLSSSKSNNIAFEMVQFGRYKLDRRAKNLKILDLSFNSSLTKLPREIGNLSRLLSLNLEGCRDLEVIKPNVIWSLTRLEELNLKDSFTNWQVEGAFNDNERRNASLSEVKNLSYLIDLKLRVPDINSVPKDIFREELVKYYISIGDEQVDLRLKNTSRVLKLKLRPGGELNEHDFEALLKKSESLGLCGLKSVKSMAYEIDNMGFKYLKHLSVQESAEIRCIVNSNSGDMDYLPAAFPCLESLSLRRLMNLENIIHEKLTTGTSFGKLREIEVSTCPKMKSLFSLYNIPRQLEKIVVRDCEMMVEIIGHHGREGVLPNIQNSQTETSFGKLREIKVSTCPKMKSLFSSYNIPRLLEKIVVRDCDHLKGLIPSFMTASLVHLRSLSVNHCKAMKEIVFNEESAQVLWRDCVDCPSLSELNIRRCRKLRLFKTNTVQIENENSAPTVSMDKELLSHHKGVVKNDLSTESSCSEITCQPHPLGPVEEHHDMVFKTKRLSELWLESFPYLQQLPKTFQTVEFLVICQWGVRLKDLATPLMCFQNLKVLMVKDCQGLTSLLSPSTAKSLSQRLTKLGISGCKSLRQVIVNNQKEADDDEIGADNIIIIFRQLKSLLLEDLSSLTSFYSGNNNVVLQFPHLNQLVVGDCPEMKTFYHGNIDCPSLHRIIIFSESMQHYIRCMMLYPNPEYFNLGTNSEQHFFWKGDVNTTIQKLWEDKNIIRDSPESEENVENAEEDHVVGSNKYRTNLKSNSFSVNEKHLPLLKIRGLEGDLQVVSFAMEDPVGEIKFSNMAKGPRVATDQLKYYSSVSFLYML